MTNTLPVNESDDLLWKHLKTIPAFRGILRAVEARFYQQIEMPHPILDVGCGDGHFAQVTFDEQIDVGIDPWWGPLQHSKKNETYKTLLQSMGNELPFPDGYFASALSNSVLEHIPDIQSVLNETSRVLRKNGRFVITMPCHYFDDYLAGGRFLRKLGADGLAERYVAFATKITRHVHVNKPEVWAERLAQAGMEIERWQYYFSPEAVKALEVGHIQGVPSAIIRALTGHWIVAPWEDSLARTERWLRPYYEEETAVSEGGYIFIVAKKIADEPINAPLPAPKPFAIAELMQAEEARILAKTGAGEHHSASSHHYLANEASVDTIHAPEVVPTRQMALRHEELVAPRSNLFNYSIIVASLFLALIGQMVISGSPHVTGRGLVWFILAGLALFFVGLQQDQFSLPNLPGFKLPTIRGVSRVRWLILPALFLSVMAQGFVGGDGAQRPFLAFTSWFAAIGLGVFALRRTSHSVENDSRAGFLPDGNTIWLALLFFGIAFSLRIFDLTTHPFMLNGIEASLGLDALNVIEGTFKNPFAIGWLTNPSLPAFISAIPIRIFGPSTFSARILSPFIGALTVTAVYLIAKKLWNQTVGILSAILLTGSHFHLHYSRLGLTNIWDALLALLALGAISLAWTGEPKTAQTRTAWLAGGLLIGLNAYVFTASRLVPIMLLVLFILAFFFERARFQTQLRHIVAASLLALVVALPQMLFYNNHPGILMERANQLGILADQTGWLSQQAASLGVSETAVLRQQIWQGFTAFNGGIDRSPSYRAETPLLSFGTGLFFAIGLVIALLKSGQNKFRMLLVWIVVTVIFAGALLLDVPTSHRLVIATPALAILAAIALSMYGSLLFNALPEALQENYKRWLQPILIVVAVLFVASDVAFYYGRYRTETRFGDRNTEIADQVATYLEQQDEPALAYFFGPPSMYTDFPTLTFIAQSYKRGINLFDVNPGETPVPINQSDKLLLIFLPERATEIDTFQVQYPNGELNSFSGVYGDPLFLVYEVEQ